MSESQTPKGSGATLSRSQTPKGLGAAKRRSPSFPNPFQPKKGENVKRIAKLGEGTYGVVYTYQINGKKYAVKRSKSFAETISSDLREVSILKAVNHPYVVKMVSAGYTGPGTSSFRLSQRSIYVVLEYAERGNLVDVLYDLDPMAKKKVAYQLLVGVDYLHSQSILHRDLKPENLLIANDGTLKIADFGLSRALSCADGTNMSIEVVSLPYRSPEVLKESRLYGEGIDVWSVGCILAELWTRKILFRGNDEKDQLAKIQARIGTPANPKIGKFPEIKQNTIERIVSGMLRYESTLSSKPFRGGDLFPSPGISGRMSLREAYMDPFFDDVREIENQAPRTGFAPSDEPDTECSFALSERVLPLGKIPFPDDAVRTVKEWLSGAAYYLTDNASSPTKIYSYALDLFCRALASCFPLPSETLISKAAKSSKTADGVQGRRLWLLAAACLWVASHYVETYPFAAGEFENADLGGFFDGDVRDTGYRLVQHFNFDVLTSTWDDIFMEQARNLRFRPFLASLQVSPPLRKNGAVQLRGFPYPEGKLAMVILSMTPEYVTFSTKEVADLGVYVSGKIENPGKVVSLPKPKAFPVFERELKNLVLLEKSGRAGMKISPDFRLGPGKRFAYLASIAFS